MDHYINLIETDVTSKLFTDDTYVVDKLQQLTNAQTQVDLVPLECDSSFTDVNDEIIKYVMTEMWELQRLLTNLVNLLMLLVPAVRNNHNDTMSAQIRGFLQNSAVQINSTVKERLQAYNDLATARARKVTEILDAHNHKSYVNALYIHDVTIRSELLDDCEKIKSSYVFLRDYIKKNSLMLNNNDIHSTVVHMYNM